MVDTDKIKPYYCYCKYNDGSTIEYEPRWSVSKEHVIRWFKKYVRQQEPFLYPIDIHVNLSSRYVNNG